MRSTAIDLCNINESIQQLSTETEQKLTTIKTSITGHDKSIAVIKKELDVVQSQLYDMQRLNNLSLVP